MLVSIAVVVFGKSTGWRCHCFAQLILSTDLVFGLVLDDSDLHQYQRFHLLLRRFRKLDVKI